ncbi:hypothetical protein [Halovenus sp. HT40]|uniref:hypothetical protein n=1 Tax=Halovenus sp. HT40 TaxID=3126691 RepID=UPI00300E7B70
MATSSWIQLDDRRASWLFLLIGGEQESNESSISTPSGEQQYWEIGIANANEFVNSKAARLDCAGITSETDLVDALMEVLNRYRYEKTLIITPRNETVQYLRRCLLRSDIDKPSLRGFRQTSVEANLEEYFGQSLNDYGVDPAIGTLPRQTEAGQPQVVSAGASRELWEHWQRIFRLLPATKLTGEAL